VELGREAYPLTQEADNSARYFEAFSYQLQQDVVVDAQQMRLLRRSHRLKIPSFSHES